MVSRRLCGPHLQEQHPVRQHHALNSSLHSLAASTLARVLVGSLHDLHGTYVQAQHASFCRQAPAWQLAGTSILPGHPQRRSSAFGPQCEQFAHVASLCTCTKAGAAASMSLTGSLVGAHLLVLTASTNHTVPGSALLAML